MRLAGLLQRETQAERFSGFLYGKGIGNQVEQNPDGLWEVWIFDDDHLHTVKSLLDQFNESPDDPVYEQWRRAGNKNREQEQRKRRTSRARVVDGRTVLYRPPVPYGVLTVTLIAISVLVAIFTQLGEYRPVVQKLQITEYRLEGRYMVWSPSLPEIRQGQVWRIFSPIFLHFNILHILFNMLWLRDLGSMVEARKGRWLLLAVVLVAGALSNVAQFLVSGPAFGGMSGVVYGLLGYVWMQGKFNARSRLALQKQTVTLMIVWFFLCLTGIMGPVANTAHAVGAGVGIAWGYLSARLS